MGVINVLDKHVAELIAAGEVVERPASVIKELVENSIDAGAKNITVEIKNGGTTFMRVTDDGCGILKEDIKTAFLRHATSKVKYENDLDSISTLGFRGEALASICAVSRLQLITRNSAEDIGSSYVIEGGEELAFDDAGCPVGTTFIIRDLFYNIPARAKFLKKDVSEGNAVSNIIDKTALSHPEIAFTYIKDGKQVLKTFGDGKLMSAIYSVFGKDFAGGLIPVEYSLNSIKINGYVSKPVHSRPNRNMQNFFINGRYVKTRTAMAALEEAFKGSIMVGKFPSCVLNIELPFEMIDVNVHPAKIEVLFINERPIFDTVYHAVKSALLKFDSRKNATFKNNTAFIELNSFNRFNNAPAIIGNQNKTPDKPKASVDKTFTASKKDAFNPFEAVSFSTEKKETHRQSIDRMRVEDSKNPFSIFSKQAVKATDSKQSFFDKINSNAGAVENKTISKEETVLEELPNNLDEQDSLPKSEPAPVLIEQNEDVIKYIGELFGTYIIAQKNNNEVLFIDKHAAHERIIYEKLKSEKAASDSQLLLQPVAVTLGKSEYDAAINNLKMFRDCAFDVEDFGNSTVIVRSAPQYLDAADISECITEMADYISIGKNDIYAEKMDWFYHNVACRSAIKAGNKSTPNELIDIVKKLEENPQIKYCPHGRPICIVMTKNEIEKQFGRV